ncbi:YceD family protein [Loigolactobacillus jiayinensis]|uniref:YceD family protein n=1 Tax=Loigolactobacillus jiayinensis TaxID=2486016 RepID=A0ABW1RFW0_9LACO|nr:YceD family protein [Loigolactobacillus jiayinensis]
MKWSLLELEKYQQEPLPLADTLDLKADLLKRDPQIIDVSPIAVSGLVSLDQSTITAHVVVTGTLTLPSTRSLKPVALPLDFEFTEIYVPADQRKLAEEDQADTVIVLENETLDLDSAVVDNILLNVPMQVLTPHEREDEADMPKGNDWEVISEDDYDQLLEARKQQGDPRFAQLKGLFDESTDK